MVCEVSGSSGRGAIDARGFGDRYGCCLGGCDRRLSDSEPDAENTVQPLSRSWLPRATSLSVYYERYMIDYNNKSADIHQAVQDRTHWFYSISPDGAY